MTSSSHDRGILLALLALRRGAIDHAGLVGALEAWATAPGQSLVDVLLARGQLRSEERAALEQSLDEELRKQLAEQATTPPSQGTASPFRTPPLPGFDLPVPSEPSVPGDELADSPRRYRKARKHDEGGLGIVFVARDVELDREVALKEIQEKHADNPVARERFELEARITGRLEHPGIVPVYGLGVYPDGRPYYAMRFIHGHTLRQEIDQYHARGRKSTPAEQGLALRSLLGRFVAVCDALSYAHARGIIHRDIKPANIMLGAYGETLVVDWGLAKIKGEATPEGEPERGPSGSGRDRLYQTRAGAVAGTPFFMSPEQAEGKTAEVGPASDIYSLGATLYYLLTRSLPYEETVVGGEGMNPLGSGKVVPPRKVKADVPAALEAVCLKAMARRPEDRYASAQALRDDIDRWLADEPPLAYTETLPEQVLRFARKHRSGTLAAAAALVVITIASLVAMVQIRAAQQREAVAYRVNLLQRDFSHGLEQFHWDRLEALDRTLAEWEALEGTLPAAQDRLHETMARWLRQQLVPTLTPQTQERIEKQVEVLRQRDPNRGAELAEELRLRLRRWDEALPRLQAPFLDAAKVLGLRQIRQEQNALVPEGKRSTVLFPTRITSPGNVRLRGVFEGWEAAPVVGLLLDHDEEWRYQFVLCVPNYQPRDHERDLKTVKGTLGEALRAGEPVSLRILRNTDELARVNLRVPVGPLMLTAERTGSRLEVQVGSQRLVFDDPFPLPPRRAGAYGLVWPDGVRLSELQGERQAQSAQPGPVEQADMLKGQGEFEKALVLYEEALRRALPTEARQEVLFKRADCLLDLERTEQGVAGLEELVAQLGRAGGAERDSWPIRAACRLWLVRLKENEQAKANEVLAQLRALYSFAELARLVPGRLRRDILDKMGISGPIWRQAYLVRDDIAKLEERISIEGLINEDGEERRQTRWRLVTACRANGQLDRAVNEGEKLLEEVQAAGNIEESIAVCREYLWLLLEAKRTDRALATVDAWLKRGPLYQPLLIERARVLAALGKPKEAQADVERFFVEVSRGALDYAEWADACLLRGYLRLEAGDRAGAEEAWRLGHVRDWPGGLPRAPDQRLKLIRSVINRTNGVTFAIQTGALLGDWKEEEAMAALDNLFSGTSLTLTTVRTLLRQKLDRRYIRNIMVDTYTTPRGRDITRRMVFRQIGFRDFHLQPGYLSLYSGCRVGAFPASGPPAEEDKLVWEGVQEIVRHFEEGRLDDKGMGRILQIWLGEVDPLREWKQFDADLDATMRQALALQFAYRYHQVGRDEVARAFLQEVVSKAAPGSAYHRLARGKLEEWKGKKP
ncbi:MAG: protein kinase [Gemmataceae bacterium]